MTTFSEEEIRSGIEKLTSETGYLEVYSVISLLQSTHLSQIARLIGKSKSTILTTINKMRKADIPFLEVDTKRTSNTKGVRKFYQLSPYGKAIETLVNGIIDYEQKGMDQEGTLPDLNKLEYEEMLKSEAKQNLERYGDDLLTHILTLGSELNFYFQRSAAHQYVAFAKHLMIEGDYSGTLPFGANFSNLKKLHISNFQQVYQLQNAVTRFLNEIESLQEKFDQTNQAKIREGELEEEELYGQIVFISLSPIIDENIL